MTNHDIYEKTEFGVFPDGFSETTPLSNNTWIFLELKNTKTGKCLYYGFNAYFLYTPTYQGKPADKAPTPIKLPTFPIDGETREEAVENYEKTYNQIVMLSQTEMDRKYATIIAQQKKPGGILWPTAQPRINTRKNRRPKKH